MQQIHTQLCRDDFLQLLWTRKHCECEDSAEHGCIFFLGEVNRLIRVQCTRRMHVSEFAISFYMYNIFNSIKICISVCVCTDGALCSTYTAYMPTADFEDPWRNRAVSHSVYLYMQCTSEKTIAMGKKGGCKILTLCVYKGEREKE